jgi:hypothetical protein
MSEDQALRDHLIELLTGKQAHVDFDTAVADLPFELQGRKPKGASHTPWEVLEHLRIAQWDILEFSRNPKHVSPNFPAGFWRGFVDTVVARYLDCGVAEAGYAITD